MSSYYATSAERKFITNLGKHGNRRCTRAELLRRYIQAAKPRQDWQSIDKAAVLRWARDLLDLEEAN